MIQYLNAPIFLCKLVFKRKFDIVRFMRLFLMILICGALFGEEIIKRPTPQEALHKLIAGNIRAIEDQIEHPNHFKESKLLALVNKQEPFAVIVACSDSRVSPEILFDQGIGDLFVVRVAGNVVGLIELESIHYAVTQLKAPIIVVMGHENCGAIQAVLKNQDQTMPEIGALIRPAVECAKGEKGDLLQNAIEANVNLVVHQLKEMDFIKKAMQAGDLEVVGSYYQLQNGVVRLLMEPSNPCVKGEL